MYNCKYEVFRASTISSIVCDIAITTLTKEHP